MVGDEGRGSREDGLKGRCRISTGWSGDDRAMFRSVGVLAFGSRSNFLYGVENVEPVPCGSEMERARERDLCTLLSVGLSGIVVAVRRRNLWTARSLGLLATPRAYAFQTGEGVLDSRIEIVGIYAPIEVDIRVVPIQELGILGYAVEHLVDAKHVLDGASEKSPIDVQDSSPLLACPSGINSPNTS